LHITSYLYFSFHSKAVKKVFWCS